MPTFPAETALRRERLAVLESFRSLRPEEFESAPTLCANWTPRDVLSHLLGQEDGLGIYVRSFGRPGTARSRIVDRGRQRGRGEMLARTALWARYPTVSSKLGALALLGETALHHQDVLRPLGRTRDIPEETRRAMLRRAAALAPRRLVGTHVIATDLDDHGHGLGRPVRGTAEALSLWLIGRPDIEEELMFG